MEVARLGSDILSTSKKLIPSLRGERSPPRNDNTNSQKTVQGHTHQASAALTAD